MRRFLSLVFLVSLSAVAEPCELCDGPDSSFEALQERIASSESAALARPTGRTSVGQIRFRVTKILKPGRALGVGDSVTPNGRYALVPGRVWLLLARTSVARQSTVVMLSRETLGFLDALVELPPKTQPAKRLAALAPYLMSADSMVAASVRKAFAQAPYAVLEKAAAQVRPDRILETLARPEVAVYSRGALFLLVGASGDKAHRKRLGTWVADARMQAAPGYDALLAAWLLLTGPDGIARIEAVLGAKDVASGKGDRARVGAAFVRALGFHARNAKVLTRAQVKAFLKGLQADPLLAEDAERELETLAKEKEEEEKEKEKEEEREGKRAPVK